MTNTLNLNAQGISSANNQSHFDAGSGIAREAQEVYADGLRTFAHQASWTDEQKAYADQRAVEWRALVSKAYNEQLQRRAAFVPVNVAGPANYPAARMQKRVDMIFKKSREWSDKMQRFQDNTKATLRSMTPLDKQLAYYRAGRWNDAISADDPHAVEKLRARLEGLQADQERMKAINAHYRKHGTAKGCPDVSNAQAEKIDHSVDNRQSYQQAQPFQSWALTNNNANIRRIKARIEQLEKLQQSAAAGPKAPKQFDGFRVEQFPEDNRLRFFFDEKPDEATRSTLKGNGFLWSPKAGAWQRQLNSNGLYACKRVIRALAPMETPETVTPEEFLQRID